MVTTIRITNPLWIFRWQYRSTIKAFRQQIAVIVALHRHCQMNRITVRHCQYRRHANCVQCSIDRVLPQLPLPLSIIQLTDWWIECWMTCPMKLTKNWAIPTIRSSQAAVQSIPLLIIQHKQMAPRPNSTCVIYIWVVAACCEQPGGKSMQFHCSSRKG